MENKTLTGKVLGETEYKASHAGVGYDAVETVSATRSYQISDIDLAVITAALKAVNVAGLAGDTAMIDAVAKRLMGQAR